MNRMVKTVRYIGVNNMEETLHRAVARSYSLQSTQQDCQVKKPSKTPEPGSNALSKAMQRHTKFHRARYCAPRFPV
jgi:hypothetical protein